MEQRFFIHQSVDEYTSPASQPTFQVCSTKFDGLKPVFEDGPIWVPIGEVVANVQPLDWLQVKQVKLNVLRAKLGLKVAEATEIERQIHNLMAIENNPTPDIVEPLPGEPVPF